MEHLKPVSIMNYIYPTFIIKLFIAIVLVLYVWSISKKMRFSLLQKCRPFAPKRKMFLKFPQGGSARQQHMSSRQTHVRGGGRGEGGVAF